MTDHAADARLRVIVVNFNSGRWLARCVEALSRSTVAYRLSIVDNGSDDESLALCRQLADDGGGAQILFNIENRGFAVACNQAALACEEPLLCFLNPDCEVAPDALERMAGALEAHPDAALAGAAVCDMDGQLQRATLRRLPAPGATMVTALGLERLGLAGINLRSELPDECRHTEAVSGAVMLVRSEPFRALGGFDEGYFLHCEDIDLFARLQRAGWTLLLEPAARVKHAKGASHRRHPLKARRWKHNSLKRYFRRHVAGSGLTAAFWSLAIELHFLATLPFHLRGGSGR